MDKEQFRIIVKVLKAVYTQPNFLPDVYSFEVWYSLLKDLPFQVVKEAAQRHIASCKFPPTIAEIRELAAKIVLPEKAPWSVEWEKVLRAIDKYGYTGETEALKSLEPHTADIVKRLGYKELCWSQNINIDRANFRDIYQSEVQRQQEAALLPQGLAKALAESKLDLLCE